MRYRVKFEFEGVQKYGIVASTYGKDQPPKGKLWIDDAVLPVQYEVDEASVIDIPFTAESMGRYEDGKWIGGDEFELYVRAQADAAQKLSDSLPDGVHVGSLFSIGVADGAAHYVVTKVTRTRATVEWRGFEGDRYYDHFFGGGRTVSIQDVARYVGRVRGLKALFGR